LVVLLLQQQVAVEVVLEIHLQELNMVDNLADQVVVLVKLILVHNLKDLDQVCVVKVFQVEEVYFQQVVQEIPAVVVAVVVQL
tara:strand:+ start:144 stop:392 length:249 start_codon:yes stop_codon:yes gene_type:complete